MISIFVSLFFSIFLVWVYMSVFLFNPPPLVISTPAVKDDVISSLRWLYTNTLHSSLKNKKKEKSLLPLSLSLSKKEQTWFFCSISLSLALNSFLSLYLSLSLLFISVCAEQLLSWFDRYSTMNILIFPVSKRNGKDKEEKPTKKWFFCPCAGVYVIYKTKQTKNNYKR